MLSACTFAPHVSPGNMQREDTHPVEPKVRLLQHTVKGAGSLLRYYSLDMLLAPSLQLIPALQYATVSPHLHLYAQRTGSYAPALNPSPGASQLRA